VKFNNKQSFYQFISDALNDEESDSLFYISEDITNLKFTTTLLPLINLFELNPNEKKNLNLLYKKIQVQQNIDENSELISKINELISIMINKNVENLNLPISFSENLSLVEFLKLYEVKFNFKNNNFFIKLTNYIEIICEFTPYKILLIPYLESVLSEAEIENLITFASQKNIYIIVCETKDENMEPKKIIDENNDEVDLII
jgi:CRISPR type II-A-associated protein Csn2